MLEGNSFVNTLKGLAGNDILQGYGGADTIDGGTGNDTAIYGGSGSGVVVTLATSPSSVGHGHGGDAEGDTLTSIENLRGSNHDDGLWGNGDANVLEGLSGKDELKGGGGADTLLGGLGADTMTGGSGGDHFVWDSLQETGITPSTLDIVMDFNAAEGDTIDLHTIDANGTGAGNTAFTFIGTDAFSAPGQIRYFNDGVDTFISLNTDSSPLDDAVIRISGLETPQESWFWL